jgi:hypothetical protein
MAQSLATVQIPYVEIVCGALLSCILQFQWSQMFSCSSATAAIDSGNEIAKTNNSSLVSVLSGIFWFGFHVWGWIVAYGLGDKAVYSSIQCSWRYAKPGRILCCSAVALFLFMIQTNEVRSHLTAAAGKFIYLCSVLAVAIVIEYGARDHLS